MTTNNPKRLIEVAFPLKQVSLDSVHEKNVRHGHISTLHIWPARRPLAASRAALIATLLPDPGNAEERKDILERMAGRVTEKIEHKRENGRMVEKVKEETTGGILHWGRENGPDLEWFRKEIRKAYGGRAPKVLDPFAGGGAIPLEAMRLGCEVTASDINPVAWFILKCTLEYPQKLAGQTRPLPEFALADRDFIEAFLKAKGFKGARLRTFLEHFGHGKGEGRQLSDLSEYDSLAEADLAWHVRAWGRWVLARARRELASYYPTYAEFQPLAPTGDDDHRPLRLLEVDDHGIAQLEPLNAEFNEPYLKDPRNPRWVAKPTVAYLWARTVSCKQCRATLPLLKTRWLCKKDNKRVLLAMEPNSDRTGVIFALQPGVTQHGGNTAQRREHDKRIGAGTMSRTGATCPCCGAIMTMSDIRYEGQAGRLGAVMTAVVVDGAKGKEYHLPTDHELEAAQVTEEQLQALYADIPFGLPEEPLPSKEALGFRVPLYGFDTWRKLFTNRQLLALGQLVAQTRNSICVMESVLHDEDWIRAVSSGLILGLERLLDFSNTGCQWKVDATTINHSFVRYALPISWDYCEANTLSDLAGGYRICADRISTAFDSLESWNIQAATPAIMANSAVEDRFNGEFDCVITDPPYYDAIPYSDLMDFFYVWLKRQVHDSFRDMSSIFSRDLCPKWNHQLQDGELIDDTSRFDGDKKKSKENYEEGMYRAFAACNSALKSQGRMVVVFANKQPDAWETLVAALIRAGFVVDGAWPIQTEQTSRTRAMSSAALASSVWIVCRKRPPGRPGWDNTVLGEMRENITQKLRDFWDAGIRGPDFVWAATGPALEAFSKHPVVKKANAPDETMTVSEFLREVRRMVVDFVVGRVLSQGGEEAVTGLDDVTTYYLLHRNDFGMEDAPVGACILYALSCNLSDSALVNQYDLLAQSKNNSTANDPEDDDSEDDDGDDNGEAGSGAKVKLKPWNRRRGRSLGLESPAGRPAPLIDQIHKLMHLWRAGDQVRVNEYLDSRGLQRNALFHQLLQALIELAPAGSDERAILEALSNHAAAHGDVRAPRYRQLKFGEAS